MAIYRGDTKVSGVGKGFRPENTGTEGQVLTKTATGYEFDFLYTGNGIDIGTYTDYSAMRGPCPTGFHVPYKEERERLYNIGITLGAWSSGNDSNLGSYLKLSKCGYVNNADGTKVNFDSGGYFWTNKAISTNVAYAFFYGSSASTPFAVMSRSVGCNIRPFKDVPVIPDSSWTTLFDGSSTATGAGVFLSYSTGLISASDDGKNWITICALDIGQYSWGTTNFAGYYYQWGNNFPFDPDVSGYISTSSTKVNASSYGPTTLNGYYGNNFGLENGFFNGCRFITGDGWDSSNNADLWGGITGPKVMKNAIHLGPELDSSRCLGSGQGTILCYGYKSFSLNGNQKTAIPTSTKGISYYYRYIVVYTVISFGSGSGVKTSRQTSLIPIYSLKYYNGNPYGPGQYAGGSATVNDNNTKIATITPSIRSTGIGQCYIEPIIHCYLSSTTEINATCFAVGY